MMKTIAIGALGVAFVHSGAAARTAAEQAQVLRDFERSVVDATQRDTCPQEVTGAAAASPAPQIITLPVAMAFA